MELEWHEVVGSIGVVLILMPYGLLQLGRLQAGDLAFSLLNWIGAALVLASLYREFNLAAAVLETAWVLIASFGITTWFRRRCEGSQADFETGDEA